MRRTILTATALFALLIATGLMLTITKAHAQDDKIVCPITEIPDRLHQKLFNVSVNVGTNRGIKLLQQSINVLRDPDIAVDGRIGPATRGALCGLSEQAVIEVYKQRQAAFYQGIVSRRPRDRKSVV